MDNFDLKKYLAEGKLHEEYEILNKEDEGMYRSHPSDFIFSIDDTGALTAEVQINDYPSEEEFENAISDFKNEFEFEAEQNPEFYIFSKFGDTIDDTRFSWGAELKIKHNG